MPRMLGSADTESSASRVASWVAGSDCASAARCGCRSGAMLSEARAEAVAAGEAPWHVVGKDPLRQDARHEGGIGEVAAFRRVGDGAAQEGEARHQRGEEETAR